MRVAISSKSVDYCIGTFRACNFDDNVNATNQVVISKLSDGYMGQFGNDAYTFENQVKSGKPVLFNNSKYYGGRSGLLVTGYSSVNLIFSGKREPLS